MARRIEHNVVRGRQLHIEVDGKSVPCFEGETVASALLCAGRFTLRQDKSGRPRGPVCNMGVCFECLVRVAVRDGNFVRKRACMVYVTDGLKVESIKAGDKI